MKKLISETKNNIIAGKVLEARSFWARSKGLLGRKQFDPDSTLWINPCNSIHTCFMQFPIDVVFVDRNLVVRKISKNVRPWRITNVCWSAHSVFEFCAGTVDRKGIELGDRLNVGD